MLFLGASLAVSIGLQLVLPFPYGLGTALALFIIFPLILRKKYMARMRGSGDSGSGFGAGGFFGKGPGQGVLKEKIPEANTDFVFAVAGEELGFIFCSLIILLILILIIRFLLQLLKYKEPYLIVAIAGLICSYGLQSLINIFSTLGIIPTKGMTLPFISYGGSSMISSSILFGFLLSLTKQKK